MKILEHNRERLVIQLVPWGTWALTFGTGAFLIAFPLVMGGARGKYSEPVWVLLLANPLAWFAYVWIGLGLWLGKVHTLTLDRSANLLRLRKRGLLGAQQVEHPLSSVRRVWVAHREKRRTTYAVELHLEGGEKLQLSQIYTQDQQPKRELADLIEGFLKPTGSLGAQVGTMRATDWARSSARVGPVVKAVLGFSFVVYFVFIVWSSTREGDAPRPPAAPPAPAVASPVLAGVPSRPDSLQVSEVGKITAGRSAALAVTREGVPYVAYVKAVSQASQRIAVMRWEAGGWRQVGAPLSASAEYATATDPALALSADGQPVVAWAEEVKRGTYTVHVSQWNGEGWRVLGQPLGQPQAPGSRETHFASAELASGPEGRLWLALSDRPDGNTASVHLYRWGAERWEPATAPDGRLPEFVHGSARPSLVVGADGQPWVGVNANTGSSESMNTVWRLGARGWQRVGNPFDAIPRRWIQTGPLLALDSRGMAVAAWSESDGVAENVYVHRWDGAQWRPLGGAIHGFAGTTPTSLNGLRVGPRDQVLLTYHEETPQGARMFVATWYEESEWLFTGHALSATRANTTLQAIEFTVDAQGWPWHVWTEKVGEDYKVFVHGPGVSR